ncbi:HlyD family efflux transporter periplasmic adaptor subunit [Sorangium sp. So ce1078]|uniref:HlyD family efflux transporter periplasmic adaptor subunit n=1 Tax=Sorangium sp. So ce1078 TaxID=3133329 RepID=UPI003F5F5362
MMSKGRCKVRDDLVYHRQDDGVRAVTLVQDPLRSAFYEMSDLQIAIMELLDGKRSFAEVAGELERLHGITVPVERIRRFAVFLAGKMLLDITSYEADPPGTRRAALRELRRRGHRFRRGESEGGRRVAGEEAALFGAGLRLIEAGRCCQAARYLAAVLEVNPHNTRARAVLSAIAEVFFRRHRLLPSHMRMVHLWNPDRFLSRIDRLIGGFVFSGWGVCLLALLLVGAAVALVDVRVPPASSFHWGNVLLAPLVIGSSTLFLHELGHGLACKHYGGKVESMGIMLFYGVVPGAYCDVTNAHQFSSRRHKIIVYLSGVLVELAVLCLWLICYHVAAESFFLRKAILVWFTYDLYVIGTNLLPLVKGYDGYFALTHYLDMPDLSERSFGHLRGLLRRALFGVGPGPAPITPRERRIFIAFAIASGAYSILFIGGICFGFLFPLAVEYLHGAGVILAVAYSYKLFGSKIVSASVAFARFLLRERRQIFTRRRTLVMAAACSAVAGLLCCPWPLSVDGRMVVEPRERAVVRAAEGGIIERITVRDGELVSRGQVLATLRSDDLALQRDRLAVELAQARLLALRLAEGPRQVEIALGEERARRALSLRDHLQSAATRSSLLADAALRSAQEHLLLAHAATRAADDAVLAERTLDALRSGAREEDIAGADALIRKLEAELAGLDARREHLTVRSPIDGVVIGRLLEERLHARLGRGDELCEIHDLRRISARIWLSEEEPLADLAPGSKAALRAHGDPHRAVEVEVRDIAPVTAGSDPFVVVGTREMENPGWPSGMSGRARIYVSQRTLAYLWIGVPLLRAIDYKVWSLLG